MHTVDFFRSLIDDPFVFGQIAANHALSDCHAMNAKPTGALAVAVVPYGLDAKVETSASIAMGCHRVPPKATESRRVPPSPTECHGLPLIATYCAPRQVEESLFQMMAGAAKALKASGCALLGGHSCEGADLSLGFCVTGHIAAKAVLRKSGLQAGDHLVLTKPLGTGVLFAADMRGAAQGAHMAAATRSMLTSNEVAARILAEHGAAACTDVTGFGLLGHLYEVAAASKARVTVDMGALPLLPGALALVQAGFMSSLQPSNLRLRRAIGNERATLAHPAYPLLFDPQTAGGLLSAVPKDNAAACMTALVAAGYPETAVIGEVVDVLGEGVCVPHLIECKGM